MEKEFIIKDFSISNVVSSIAQFRREKKLTSKIKVLVPVENETSIVELKKLFDDKLVEFELFLNKNEDKAIKIKKHEQP